MVIIIYYSINISNNDIEKKWIWWCRMMKVINEKKMKGIIMKK